MWRGSGDVKDHGENDQNGIPELREHTKTIVAPSNGCRITGYIHLSHEKISGGLAGQLRCVEGAGDERFRV